MSEQTITPKVDAVREFLEIAGDFTNPLEIIREAISNSVDAGATTLKFLFTRPKEAGRPVLVIDIEDNGIGMDLDGLQSFFDLGNSSKRSNPTLIGEKGHGTKVFFQLQQDSSYNHTSGHHTNCRNALPFGSPT